MAINTIKATIQMRNGMEDDFDPTQMTVGEWSVSRDTKYVRMCFIPGLCLRMATYEAFEEDMLEIQVILATCQNIQTAVEAFEQLAERHKNDASASAKLSESWAVGGTGVRVGEDTNNSKYFSDLARTLTDEAEKLLDQAQKVITASTQGALIPGGTVAFADLPLNPAVGYMYNISDDFTTDSRFEDGAGIFYRAGANVYWTSGEKWDVMVGTQVTGVKGSSDSIYRIGNVNISPSNIGLENVENKSSSMIRGELTESDVTSALGYTPVPEDSWTENTKDHDGYVAKGVGYENKVWKTDENGNPGWRDDEDTWRGIQDNLMSTSTTDSLSANQGRVLNEALTELNGNMMELNDKAYLNPNFGKPGYTPPEGIGMVVSGIHLNNVTVPGLYFCSATDGRPISSDGFMIVISHTNGVRAIQIYFPYAGGMHKRLKTSDLWGSWTQISSV